MTGSADTAQRFLELHQGGAPLLLPNAWDAGSAKLFQALGFDAIATTSAGHATTLGRLDGNVSRDEALAHARDLVAAVDLPVSADYENAFADAPADVAANIALAAETGLAGCSVEDYDGNALYDAAFAAERVAAAVEAAHAGGHAFVITARAENFFRKNPDLADTIARLQSYQEAGADVLYAPGLPDIDAIRTVVAEVDRPVNVLALPGAPPVAELARGRREAHLRRQRLQPRCHGCRDHGRTGAARTGHLRLVERRRTGVQPHAQRCVRILKERQSSPMSSYHTSGWASMYAPNKSMQR